MKNSILKSVLLLFTVITFSSCSNSDNNSNNPPSGSRNVKYEITGNAIGTFDATYANGSGQAANEMPLTIPWSKDVIFQSNVTTASISSAVTGATAGQTITTKIFVGGVVKKEQTATVQANGAAIIPALTYVLN
ncbi:MmpS family transport accessory protein [Flavobacterium sp.]|uniref:MmpS family transport accessory protein n=1 Tax=Flavobacterium sp. TaxID=239 RepID=UPI00286DC59F|nr:MmpS family transport accessory protein [Flavobacterium sp.]